MISLTHTLRLVQSRQYSVAKTFRTRAAAQDRFLYWGSGSFPCWRVMISLEEKQLPYDSKLLEFSKREHKSEEVTVWNPRGQLPTFRDGEGFVHESAGILLYLENQYPENSLLPSNPAEKAKVFQRFTEVQLLDLKHRSYSYPKRKGLPNPQEDAHIGEMKAEFDLWENYLSTQKYAATDEFTLADAMLAPLLLTLERWGMTFREYPNMKRYCDMIRDRPSIVKASPPHWKDAEPSISVMNIV